jgi:hypothetical protein
VRDTGLHYDDIRELYRAAALTKTDYATRKAAAYLAHLDDGAKHSDAMAQAALETEQLERQAAEAQAEVDALRTFIRYREVILGSTTDDEEPS